MTSRFTGIRAELDRVRRALHDDPAGTIGAAKQLFDSDATVPELVKETQRALGLHPSTVLHGARRIRWTEEILGGVSSNAIGLAELRNRGYGAGTAGPALLVGLGPCHVWLAVNAATT